MVSIKSTSEEAKRRLGRKFVELVRYGFPLNQLPKKLKADRAIHDPPGTNNFSIKSTSEEAKRIEETRNEVRLEIFH